MKIFTCNTFTGIWPVPTAAIVTARDKETAAAILNEALRAQGLKGDAAPSAMEEYTIPTFDNQQEVRILSDGDY